MSDLITITSSVLPATTRVVAFRGVEAISRPYQFDISFVLRNDEGDAMDLADAMGAKATLTIDRTTDALPPFVFSGILASVELLHEAEGQSLFRAVLVPKLWLLSLSRHSRIFTKQRVPEVIEAILEDNGLSGSDYELRLDTYEVEEHICQYRESDLDFISRWMEREGIFYFFEHGPDGEKLILCDERTYEQDVIGKAVRYYPQVGQDRSAGPSFRSFTYRHATLPSMVKLRDHDYARPNLNVAGSARVSAEGVGEVSLYGERFFTPSAGDKLAKMRAEEMLAQQVLFQAGGTRFHLRSGYVFELEEHPRAPLNASYLTIEARHHGNQAVGMSSFRELLGIEHEDVYFVELTAIPAKTQFRAPSRTAWPRIYGYENGVVDGAAESEYAQIDDQGRYNIKFRFDESSLKSGKASTYVRMMQPHGGGIEGFHFPLRKGTEVVLSFLGGDPDRPVISGVVPNALTPSPVTSGNFTKNVLQTGGRNRLEIEDRAGQQRITLSTPYSNTHLRMGSPNAEHEMIVKTDDNTLLDAGKNFDLRVGQNGGGSWDAKIKDNWVTHVESGKHELFVDSGTSATTVLKDTSLHVIEGNLTTDVDAGKMTTNVKGDTTTTVSTGNFKTQVQTGDYTALIDSGNTLIDTVSGTTDIKSKGKLTIETQDQCEVKVKSNMMLTVDGNVSKEVKGSETLQTYGPFKKLFVSNNVNVTSGFKSDTFLGLSNTNAFGASVGLFVGGKATLELSGAFTATYAAKLDITGGVALAFKYGASLTINAAVEVTVRPTSIETGAAKISQLPTRLAMSALRYHLSGVHVLS
ncbi:type VI secretion system Vgr family protein [Chondromyces apiculatus]|uniref:VgrG protein n=1 Tax=Chondromyces apiculatus DSM 436 TaxID=1192034 RepID=A0A017T9L8_9BACT|nr:type VI secretion system tip protein TssI/VgrG [Chondromyces apiculatus]EYF05505.1 VgrG protein [Chondromyces apiculatus DSM 436]